MPKPGKRPKCLRPADGKPSTGTEQLPAASTLKAFLQTIFADERGDAAAAAAGVKV